MSNPNSTEPIIIVRDLNKSFGMQKALQGINLDVQPGEIMVIWAAAAVEKARCSIISSAPWIPIRAA